MAREFLRARRPKHSRILKYVASIWEKPDDCAATRHRRRCRRQRLCTHRARYCADLQMLWRSKFCTRCVCNAWRIHNLFFSSHGFSLNRLGSGWHGADGPRRRLILRRMLKAQIVSVMMVTLGLLIFLKAACLAIWGPDQIALPQIFPSGAIDFAGIFITYNYVAAFALASALNIGFLLFYRFTSLGLMQRCAADNSRAALAIGIHVSNQVSIAWAVSAALAGLGGTLLASLGGLSLGISDIGLIAFPLIVVGGLVSLAGALIARFLLGILEAFTEGILTPNLEEFLRSVSNVQSVGALQQVIPYALLVLMLLLRPQGMFGRRGAERV